MMMKEENKGFRVKPESIPYWPLVNFDRIMVNFKFSPSHLKLIKFMLEHEEFIKDREVKLTIIESCIVRAVIEKIKGGD